MATFYTGDTVRLSATFENFAGTVTDPTTIVCSYKDPSGAASSSTFASSGSGGWIKASTGNYSFDLEVTLPGTWTYAFEGTGTVDKYDTRTFEVRQRPVG